MPVQRRVRSSSAVGLVEANPRGWYAGLSNQLGTYSLVVSVTTVDDTNDEWVAGAVPESAHAIGCGTSTSTGAYIRIGWTTLPIGWTRQLVLTLLRGGCPSWDTWILKWCER